MNSKFLQDQNPKVYQNFFNKYDLVISTSLIENISGVCNKFLKHTNSLSYKLPLKLYIWINQHKINSWPIEFTYKNNSQEDFCNWYLNYFYQFNEETLKDIELNYEIWFLAEYNYVDPILISGLMAIAKLLIKNNISVNDFSKFNISNFQYIDKLQLLLKFFYDYKNIFYNFWWKADFYEWVLWASFLESWSFLLFERDWENFNFYNFKEKHFHDLKLSSYIINTNIPSTQFYEKDTLQDTNQEIKIFSESKKYIYKDNLVKWVENTEKYFSIKLSKNISDIYYNIPSWKNLFGNIKNYQKILDNFFFHKQNIVNYNKRLAKILSKKLNINHEEEIAMFTDQKIKIWTDKNIKITQQKLDEINQEYKQDMTIDFSSFQDDYSTDWVKLEQYNSRQINSSMVSKYVLKKLTEKKLEKQGIEYEEVLLNLGDCLFLDAVNNKIYLHWKKLTSKDILSQTSTIEIMKIAIENIWQEITNRKLPPSSYSKNKNEMVWKIISPLTHFIKEKTWIELPFSCTGSLWNFFIKLNPSSLKINIIERLSIN